jgi:hypothetical protein
MVTSPGAILADLESITLRNRGPVTPLSPTSAMSPVASTEASLLTVDINWSRCLAAGFCIGGQWTSVLALRFSHVFAAVANLHGGLCTGHGSLLPPGAPSGPQNARGRFEPLDPATVPPLPHEERFVPLLLVTGTKSPHHLQCQFAQLCFNERGHPVEYSALAGEPLRWNPEFESLVWHWFSKQCP